MESRLAIFDLDLTLLNADCEQIWCYFMARKGIVDETFLLMLRKYIYDYDAGSLNYAEYEYFLQQPLVRRSADEVQELIGEYLNDVEQLFRPNMLKRLEEHRQNGDELLLASASDSLLVEPIAQHLQIPNLICTQLELKNGVPTGRLAEEPLFRERKAQAIQKWIKAKQFSLQGSWGYSDSHNDLAFLKLVEHPVAVTPDSTLRQYAQEHGWQIID